jgi:group I intron endonuclease
MRRKKYNPYNISGIYKIKNIKNGKVYIGSAINMRKRWNSHLNRLLHNKHDNQHLQASYNKNGISYYELSILEHVENLEELLNREQYWMDFYNSYDRKCGYNALKIAGSNWKMKVSDETRKKLRESHLNKKRSPEANKKIIEKMNKTVFQIDMNNLKIINVFKSCKEAGEIVGIFPQSIAQCCRRVTKTAKGYYWSYDYSTFTPLDKYHKKPQQNRYIVCNTTGQRWKNFREAGAELSLTKNQIYSKIKWGEMKYEYENNR